MPDNTLQAEHANKYRFIFANGEEVTIDASVYVPGCILCHYIKFGGVFNENKVVVKFHNITFTEDEIKSL